MIERALLTRARALEGKCEADLMLREEGSPFLARGVRPGPPRQRCPSCTLAGIRPPARVRRCRWDRRRLRRPATGRSRALSLGRLRSPWEDSPRYHWGWRRQPQDSRCH